MNPERSRSGQCRLRADYDGVAREPDHAHFASQSKISRQDSERMMPAVVNLNRFRKAKKAAEAERRAAENRAAFGRAKAERRKADDEREQRKRDLDGKRIE